MEADARERSGFQQTDNTWTQSVLQPSKDATPCNVVLKEKLDNQGPTSRYKARIFPKGYVQKDVVDYDETFAPVIPFDVVLLIAATLTWIGWYVHHADISSVLLDVDIDGEL